MNWISWMVIGYLCTEFLLHRTAARLDLRVFPKEVPEPFRGELDKARLRRAEEYLYARTRLAEMESTVFLIAIFGLWFGRGFVLLDVWTRNLAGDSIYAGLLFVGTLAGLGFLLSQGFQAAAVFGSEARFGFNRTTPGLFARDCLLQAALGVLLGGGLLWGVLLLFHTAGNMAWWLAWLAVSLFLVGVQYVAPSLILPLFNRFTPLAQGSLRQQIRAYLSRWGFPEARIMVMDGSRRSTKSNAFFTGFGRHRRIVLFDTLIANHTDRETVAILAHELGHYRRHHILKGLLLAVGQTGLTLYLLSVLLPSPDLYSAFFLSEASIHAGLVFFTLAFSPVAEILGLSIKALSRRWEGEADRFALCTTRDPEAFRTALKRLSIDNLSNLAPHPLSVILHGSHPPVLRRLEKLEKIPPDCWPDADSNDIGIRSGM